jgi:nitrogen fixation/metabolism regulation signal transduction histidine kinase
MVTNTLRKLFSGSKPIIILFTLVLLSLYLMSKATYNSTNFGQLYPALLIINTSAMFLLVVLIIKNLYRLIIQYRNHEPGSRLTTRLVIMLTILSVTPVSLVYYYSLDFLRHGIDDWFNITVEKALSDSLELSQASLGLRMRELTRQTTGFADQLISIEDDFAAIKLHELRTDSTATELTLFNLNGHIIASSSFEHDNLIPIALASSTQLNLRQSNTDGELITLKDTGLHIRVAVLLPHFDPSSEQRVVQALYPISDRMNMLADTVTKTFTHYRELLFLRKPLRNVFVLTLSMVLLLSLLTSVWAAFFFARRFMQPISDLVEGTRAVADGNYQKKLDVPGKDELSFLVGSFNQMTNKISAAQIEASQSQKHAEEQRSYLEAVLSNLSSGVITLDENHKIKTSNTIAEQILSCKLNEYLEKDIVHIIDDNTHLHAFFDIVLPNLNSNKANWNEEIIIFGPGGRRILMCRGTTLPASGDIHPGHVVVFDDITTLLQAQRDAAWGEVARRLAHEIKNPLTPIQLSAERLRHKYLDKNKIDDPDLLDRSTNTIVNQVETLKEMVKAFSEYAKMPSLKLRDIDLNKLILEIINLYKDTNTNIQFENTLDPLIPKFEADIGRLRQVLHNLIKNSVEAFSSSENTENKITVKTQSISNENSSYVEVKINDNGPGISDDVLQNLFDPYVSTKVKGTGLGLAIVKKIVEEHSGVIWAENPAAGGTSIVIRLPIIGTTTSDLADNTKNNIDETAPDSDNNDIENGKNNSTG